MITAKCSNQQPEQPSCFGLKLFKTTSSYDFFKYSGLTIFTARFVLLVHVCRELVYLSKLIYQSPKVLIEEMSLPNLADSHYLQTISLSGRKIVTWSEPIHLDVIKTIREHTGAATCEIQLYATGAALRDFFKRTKNEVGRFCFEILGNRRWCSA